MSTRWEKFSNSAKRIAVLVAELLASWRQDRPAVSGAIPILKFMCLTLFIKLPVAVGGLLKFMKCSFNFTLALRLNALAKPFALFLKENMENLESFASMPTVC